MGKGTRAYRRRRGPGGTQSGLLLYEFLTHPMEASVAAALGALVAKLGPGSCSPPGLWSLSLTYPQHAVVYPHINLYIYVQS
jgi:hypothetical protein